MSQRVARRTLALLLSAVALAALGTAVATARYPAASPALRADAAVVLGAAVWDGAPSPVFAARLDHAATLYREGRVRRVLLTGGRRERGVRAESEVGREHLRRVGVPDSALAAEGRSATTWQNLTCIRPHLDPDARVLIVSDPLHLRRAVAMARELGIDAAPAATPSTRYRSWRTQAPFLAREVWFSGVHAVAELAGVQPGCPPVRG